MAYLSRSNSSHHSNDRIGRSSSSGNNERRDPSGIEMYPPLRNSQQDHLQQHEQHQHEQATRSTTPLSFYCTSPWNDQEFQELAMQALTAATSSDQECGGDSAAPVSVPATNIRNGSTNAIDTKRGVRFLDTARSGLNAADSAKKLSVVDVQRDEKPSKKRDYEAHTINGTIAPAPTVSRRKKKPKGMPKRPLSAYNFFFQKERVNVLAEAAGENASDVDALMAFMPEFPEEDSGHNSSSHNNNIQSSNAPVSFENLGKTIGRRWQSLSQIERKRYELLAQEDAVRYKGEMDAFHEAKRARNERQAVYEPKELPSSNAGSSVHDFGGHISVLSGPPEIRFLPYNFPLQARFPGQMHPGESLSQYKHPPEWPPQPPASAPAVAVSGSASSEVEAPSEYQFPVPPGTEILLPDPFNGGRERCFRVDYKFYSMTRKDAEIYMQNLASFPGRMMPYAVPPPEPMAPPPHHQQHQQQQQHQQYPHDKGYPSHHQQHHYWH